MILTITGQVHKDRLLVNVNASHVWDPAAGWDTRQVARFTAELPAGCGTARALLAVMLDELGDLLAYEPPATG